MSYKESDRPKTSIQPSSSPSRSNSLRSGARRFRNLSLVSGDDQIQVKRQMNMGILYQGEGRSEACDNPKACIPETHHFVSPSQVIWDSKTEKSRSVNKASDRGAQRPKTALDAPDLMSYLRMGNGTTHKSPFLSNHIPKLNSELGQSSREKTTAHPISIRQDDSIPSFRISEVSRKDVKKVQPVKYFPSAHAHPSRIHLDTNCNLEFVNKEFRYDEEEGEDGDSSEDEIENLQDTSTFQNSPGQLYFGLVVPTLSVLYGLKKVIKSVLNIPMAQALLDNTSLPDINYISNATLQIGQKMCKAGVGVASLIFGEGSYLPQDKVCYNGYSFTTYGALKLAALRFHRNKSCKIRAIIQTPDFDTFALNAKRKHMQEPKIFISERKWVLASGFGGVEYSGFFEITAPIESALWGIHSEGPCSGLIFVDVP